MKGRKIFMWLAAVVLLTASCSDSDYLNAIPEGCTALVSVDMAQTVGTNQSDGQTNPLARLLRVDELKDCGIDLASKLYFFEAPDGMLGMAAKVDSQKRLAQWLEGMSDNGMATKLTERRGFEFCVLRDSWVVGFSESAMLVMGPVAANAQAALVQQVATYLAQNEEQGIKGTPMFAKLDSIGSSVALVAQAQALPEKFVAPFTLGAPKEADASQVLIAAEMTVDDGCLNIQGETFSFNKRIDAALRQAQRIFRPIRGDYAASMAEGSLLGVFMNVRGADFLTLLQQNKGIMALLTGINTAIDMDNILRSVDGDMSVTVPVLGDKFDITMAARLAQREWLKDVDYWKRSCPSGGRIIDTGKDSFCYTDGQTTFHFGVTADNQFFAGSTAQLASAAIGKAQQPLPDVVRKQLVGQKMVAVIRLSAIDNEVARTVIGILEPLFGPLTTVIYSLKGGE